MVCTSDVLLWFTVSSVTSGVAEVAASCQRPCPGHIIGASAEPGNGWAVGAVPKLSWEAFSLTTGLLPSSLNKEGLTSVRSNKLTEVLFSERRLLMALPWGESASNFSKDLTLQPNSAVGNVHEYSYGQVYVVHSGPRITLKCCIKALFSAQNEQHRLVHLFRFAACFTNLGKRNDLTSP